MVQRFISLLLVCFICQNVLGQNITVDSQSFTPQQLIEDILIDSDCIENVTVTNVVTGNFANGQLSYGYFDGTGTTFPFERGLVMSTGQLFRVPGPNTTLSDDDAPGWDGDNDLEVALNETNTFNATILEFDFTSITSQISFRYLFASEEYQENNSNTCIFSDLFGFLIRPTGSTDPYTNIALVPNSNTPVKVTTVHSGIPGPGGCPPINEQYFGSWNGANTPINFNGQTEILTATATVIPNQSYHVKLVIADEFNARFDSAVFLEAGSFELTRDLGPDRLIQANNALCENETLIVDATIAGNNGYDWFRDGVLVQSDPVGCTNCGTYEITQAGTYNVEINLDGNCGAIGTITVEYAQNPIVFNSTLSECDFDQDGLTTYNLFDGEIGLTNNNQNLGIVNFFLSQSDAEMNINPIQSPTTFENTTQNQIVFALIENISNCTSIAELTLSTSNNSLNIPTLEACDFGDLDGITTFNLDAVSLAIENQIPAGATINFFTNEADALSDANPLPILFENDSPNSQTIYVKVDDGNSCYAIAEVNLVVSFTPEIMEDETIYYCSNTFPETIRIIGGVVNDVPNNYYYQWQLNGQDIEEDTIEIEINDVGTYTVIVTHPNGCSSSRDITVLPSEIPTIGPIDVNGTDNINTVTISALGNGDYEFALDSEDGPYQNDNVFTNITPGFHTVFVRDKNGCGVASEVFSVLGFPKFFTPNGDTQNDFWQLDGVNFQRFPNLQVFIFDRYGKLLVTQDSNSSGWDGTYNGNLSPNTDYWFTANFGDGRTFTGHFALKR
ncbi:MAG: gliding motility-associated C-terminal domain-containing protein [Winogradskyella sp.]|uniref:T9SS type B sorting domain-containing protein n=1 Tax=Winogradskyella sp. TaxID=1883156 RepID=UPI000F3BA3EB|nr:choice-of-anchor L domain-containing protein [Winogradskyella sp.]RNC84907.1 MAG: gliding motility-associated C-terminal domain-containing protein [Winogradskyella sp.]